MTYALFITTWLRMLDCDSVAVSTQTIYFGDREERDKAAELIEKSAHEYPFSHIITKIGD